MVKKGGREAVTEPTNVPVDFEKLGGIVPVIAQDDESGDVLMMAYMNQKALEETVRTGRVCYFSRSRNRLWRKGEQSGHVQELRSMYMDCDSDTLLVRVKQVGGAACHEGYRSCFFRRVEGDKLTVVGERVFDPEKVYGKKG